MAADPVQSAARRELLPRVRALFEGVARRATPLVAAAVAESLRAQPHYAALNPGGVLHARYRFGPGHSPADAIVEAASRAVRVVATGPAGDSLGGLRVVVDAGVLGDLHRAAGAGYARTSTLPVPWLETLLAWGDQPLYDWGQGGMTRRWTVPLELAGAVDDNWLTAAAAAAEPWVREIFEQTVRELAL